MSPRTTPVMRQHQEAKRAHPDAIVFFRLGDFYEMFGEDALLAAKVLDLTLTSRNRGKPDEVPMAGVPHHAAHGYVARLLELGHQVAICEQMADPSTVKGIVPRQVVRVITPGLVTEGEQLEAGSNNFLGAAELGALGVGLSLLDLSTGELSAARLGDGTELLGALGAAAPRELLLGAEAGSELLDETEKAVRALGKTVVRRDQGLAESEIPAVLGVLEQDARALDPLGRRAVGRVLRFAHACYPGVELPLRRIQAFTSSRSLLLDVTTQAHLELTESPAGKEATLLSGIDATSTPAGARLLRRWLLSPSLEVEEIRRRLDRVELFVVHARLRGELRRELKGVGDLERLAMRASLGQVTPRDLGGLRDGLGAVERAVGLLEVIEDPELRGCLELGPEPVDTVGALRGELEQALVERPPAQAKEGAVFRQGYDHELDQLSELGRSGTEHMVELEARLKKETGIATLKLRFTRVFGWYVEVSRSQASRVPEAFRRKQTVASGERYTTPELSDLADRISHAEERHRLRELELLKKLAARAAQDTERVRALSARVARWDVAQGLAEIAHRHDYARPELDDSDGLSIRDGRHPTVERLSAAGRFVPNDVDLSPSRERLWLVTGPNMAGKSTFLRQVALITILAQMGSYVPARSAQIGIVDRVLSRVGASDNLARGESTFMVEMRETAQILRSATRRSLVILDEIGRGTSTFDGLSIAWAVAEYLDEVIGCRGLFATHYHELYRFAEESRHAACYSVGAREIDGDVVFLHRLSPGAASRSYGVEVAKLAGIPESVLSRARAILSTLESDRRADLDEKRGGSRSQLDLFNPDPATERVQREVIDTIRALELDRLSGLEALQLLSRLREKL